MTYKGAITDKFNQSAEMHLKTAFSNGTGSPSSTAVMKIVFQEMLDSTNALVTKLTALIAALP